MAFLMKTVFCIARVFIASCASLLLVLKPSLGRDDTCIRVFSSDKSTVLDII
ncbi:hypothetical protein PR003_g23580 [Phytophthora rubi]|uniref:Uncharacterized protein n=1 Tax=Phytophthora rubi TaxID=129364 RepID=A0A6A3KSE8_9STRA|nr:hypothetical protein PR001_g16227 [Phytophthora rubi]KAE9010927.1 hypothetical protein PR002_g15232 [Phytophthora rubi]KAE9297123.1 hypothetical protein PR003_g23580 [Phytophthora rubi]